MSDLRAQLKPPGQACNWASDRQIGTPRRPSTVAAGPKKPAHTGIRPTRWTTHLKGAKGAPAQVGGSPADGLKRPAHLFAAPCPHGVPPRENPLPSVGLSPVAPLR